MEGGRAASRVARPPITSIILTGNIMSNLLTNRGVQAATVTAGILAILTAVSYQPLLLAVWAAWAVIAAVAIVGAVRS